MPEQRYRKTPGPCVFAACVLAIGCTPALQRCTLENGFGRWQDGHYDLLVLLHNSSETEAVDVPGLTFHVSAYDGRGELLSEHSFVESEESLAPLDLTRINLSVPDEDARVRSCHIVVSDARDHVICERTIPAGGTGDSRDRNPSEPERGNHSEPNQPEP